MNRICFALIFFLLFFLLQAGVAVSVFGQLVKIEFPRIVLNEPFDEDRDIWRNMSNSENLFLMQGGEYVLRRKNMYSPYSIFPAWKNTLPAYRMQASMKLDDLKNEEAFIGLIFMAQQDGSGAFVFELNARGQYRLKQLVGVNFKLLTGDIKTDGWVNETAVNPAGQFNLVDIRTARRNYDIYLNEKYLFSFTEPAYKTGDIGISIGPATRARIDFISIHDTEDDLSKKTGESTTVYQPTEAGKDPTSAASEKNAGASEVILKLVEQVSKLTLENQVLKDSLQLLRKQLEQNPAPTKSK